MRRYLARPHGDLVSAIRDASGDSTEQVGGYLKILSERYRLIERRLPIFAAERQRLGRYYLTDNFLRSWLAALANPVAALEFRPVDELVREADARLCEAEGTTLEKLAGELYEERIRKGIGDFPLSQRITGYWDRNDTEIDLVAVNAAEQVIRFGSCKRAPARLLSDVNNFRGHVERFRASQPRYDAWRVELVGIAPRLDDEARSILQRHEVFPQDLLDLTDGLE